MVTDLTTRRAGSDLNQSGYCVHYYVCSIQNKSFTVLHYAGAVIQRWRYSHFTSTIICYGDEFQLLKKGHNFIPLFLVALPHWKLQNFSQINTHKVLFEKKVDKLSFINIYILIIKAISKKKTEQKLRIEPRGVFHAWGTPRGTSTGDKPFSIFLKIKNL